MIENDTLQDRLPQFPEPYWRDSVKLPTFPKLEKDIAVDVAIVGGGISGITAAYLLAQHGVKVALVEADRILNGTTGHTTAKVTAQHGLIYDELSNHLGEEKARMYYEAADDALQFIRNTIGKHNIECDWTEEDAYVYTNSHSYISKIINEFKAYEKLGIKGEFTESIALPIQIKAAVVMKNQAQFHPVKYLKKLVERMTKNGSEIYEQTTAISIERGTQPKVVTRDGYKITCEHVVACSHFPFYDAGFYFSRMYAERSYIIAVKTAKDYPGGMYISAEDPVRSLRYTNVNGEKLVLIAGENHKTGQGVPMMQHYEALQSFGDEVLGIKEIPYRWSAQDFTTLDKVPYIGQMNERTPNIFVATGYRKWGMTNGTAAALLLTDLVLEKENRYRELYTPSRFYADPSVKKFISLNTDVAKHLIEGKLEFALREPENLAADEGAVVSVNGKRAGAYKDKEGTLHIIDTTCTHMGCELEWNSGDRTWDCPCHGSRFSIHGDVAEGPAKKPLKKLEQ
ncbi:glycine/D-amino acid oxidase-like deaminating enzyme [Anoxybacillus vitaminiphilus]|uniref:Glycine/D-amino acid oxidase-like deaminating enzyme n=1 Tax=Paranoxybacillus vitaminiphilus TaxID=581036 RepID=A0A327YHQ3_9BACL|nr:FAD-dependent oxidoreductase [Anoxybacillus vitaminiphilus]RAK20540.1 glycine/D-amino acid oxidase-like deaminating enzyme [Anoxybacillus vitaminiphilus]